ncbi:MAG: pilus assembly protein [Clostridiaceae bacterium]|nr:pilus assembly protein [Clostridiaceae bacterium]
MACTGNIPGRVRHEERRQNACSGAVTIEYALVFPLVIFSVMILIYLGMVYYQQALLQSIVSEQTQNWAFLWGYDANEVQQHGGVLSREGYQSEGLYWHIFSNPESKKEIIRNTIAEDYQRRSLLKSDRGLEVHVTYDNYFIYQKVGVQVTATYSSPIKGLFQVVGLSGDISVKASCETTLHDPKEFIHNVDYLLQIYEESGAQNWVQEKLKPLQNSLKKMKDYFK